MLSENINNLLDNLFYKEKLGIGNKTTFIKNVRDKNPKPQNPKTPIVSGAN